MKVLTVFPPNYREINAAFGVRGREIIFAFGDTIYNPSRIKIPPCLMAHESVHARRQNGDPAAWWRRYIDDPSFRLAEEIPAHVAEYQAAPHLLQVIARRLSSPLYGGLISMDGAVSLIQRGVDGH